MQELPWSRAWKCRSSFPRQLLVDSGRFDVRVVEEPAGLTRETLAVYDLVVSDYCGPRWGPSTEQALVEFVRGGKGLVAVHGAAYGFSGHDVLADRHARTGITEPAWKEHAEMVGGSWPQPPSKQFHGARHSFRVRVVDPEHPVAKGLGEGFTATDELYHQMTLLPSARVLATAWSDPATAGRGRTSRSCGSTPSAGWPGVLHPRPGGRGGSEPGLPRGCSASLSPPGS